MSTLLRGCCALVTAAFVTCSAAAADTVHDHAVHGQGPPSAAAFRQAMDAGMARMMEDMHAPGYSGNPDIDFLSMMIPHHEGAVEMARLLLIHGNDPATRRLAEDIIASQQVEIAGMRRRLEQLRGPEASRAEPYPELGGTRGIAPSR